MPSLPPRSFFYLGEYFAEALLTESNLRWGIPPRLFGNNTVGICSSTYCGVDRPQPNSAAERNDGSGTQLEAPRLESRLPLSAAPRASAGLDAGEMHCKVLLGR